MDIRGNSRPLRQSWKIKNSTYVRIFSIFHLRPVPSKILRNVGGVLFSVKKNQILEFFRILGIFRKSKNFATFFLLINWQYSNKHVGALKLAWMPLLSYLQSINVFCYIFYIAYNTCFPVIQSVVFVYWSYIINSIKIITHFLNQSQHI